MEVGVSKHDTYVFDSSNLERFGPAQGARRDLTGDVDASVSKIDNLADCGEVCWS